MNKILFSLAFLFISIFLQAQPGDYTGGSTLRIYKPNGMAISIKDTDYIIFPDKYLVYNDDLKKIYGGIYNEVEFKEFEKRMKEYVFFYWCQYCTPATSKYQTDDSIPFDLITILHKNDTMAIYAPSGIKLDSFSFMPGKYNFSHFYYDIDLLSDSALRIIRPEWNRYISTRSDPYESLTDDEKDRYRKLVCLLIDWEKYRVSEWPPEVKEILKGMSISKYYSKKLPNKN